MKYLFIIILAISLSFQGMAQNTLDILNLSGRFGFPQEYETTYPDKASEYGSFLNLTVPLPITENTIWYTSLNHFYFNVQGDESIPMGEVNPIILNGFILRTGLYQKFNNGQGVQVLFAPRFMTDFNNVDGNSWQFGAVLLYEKVFSDNLAMSFGAMYNQELFGPYFVPIVNLSWWLNEKWHIKGFLPVNLKINYLANKNLTVGFSHFGLVSTYYLGADNYSGDYIERQSIDLALFARQRIAGNIYLEAKAGRTFGRSYKQFAGDQKVDFSLPLVGFGDERVAKNVQFCDGFILELGVVYNIILPD